MSKNDVPTSIQKKTRDIPHFRIPSSAKENDDSERLHWLPSAKADVHQNGLNETAAPNITENSQPCEILFPYHSGSE
jgi:hypothetical protein